LYLFWASVIEETVGLLVQRGDCLVILRIKLEVEDIQILDYALLADGLGMATTPRCVSQRNTTCAIFLPCLLAIERRSSFWNKLFFPSAQGPTLQSAHFFPEVSFAPPSNTLSPYGLEIAGTSVCDHTLRAIATAVLALGHPV
jgi:hypothetical protein